MNRFGPLALVRSRRLGYTRRRLEKRSQALQACNLTRNIQADGAPMVHRTPGGVTSPGVFFHHRTPELCLRKRIGTVPKTSLSNTIRSQFGAIAFSSFHCDRCRPATYRGLSGEVHED